MISFVIPTKNEEKILEKTLSCLVKYIGDKEIIVSDAGSTDRTIQIAEKLANKVIVHDGKTRQNIAGGRNSGAQAATGEYISFVDADMYFYEPNIFFPKAISIFESDPLLVGLTVKLKVLPEFETVPDKITFSIVNFLFYFQNNVLKIGAASGEFQMVRAKVFKELGGFNESLPVSEDVEFFKRLSKVGHTRYEGSLTVYHTGRRAHKVGWPKLLYSWIINWIFVIVLKRSAQDEWKEVR